MLTDCIFCQIVARQAPASIVYEDDLTLAFMSLSQPTRHKVLVIPKAHLPQLYDLDPTHAAAVMQTTVKVATAIQQLTDCPGLNLVQFNGLVQDVPHFHFHVLPRYPDDGIRVHWSSPRIDRATLDSYAEEIRARLE